MAVARWHGTPGGYTNHDCRCADCRLAIRAYQLGRNLDHDVEMTDARRRYLEEFDRHLRDRRWDRSWMDDLIADLARF